MRALVVEDDPVIALDVRSALEAGGFVVDHSGDGEDAWFRGDVEDYDVVVLDLGLPRLDGLSLLRRWREAGRDFPILVLSARSDWTEKVEGIEAGADDYLAKPFQVGELMSRVRALIRRMHGRVSGVIEIGALRLDTRRMLVAVAGRDVRISPLEFRFLNYLGHHADRAVPAVELAEHLYGTDEAGDTNAIEALVTRLRRKIGGAAIETRRGFGYRLTGEADGGA